MVKDSKIQTQLASCSLPQAGLTLDGFSIIEQCYYNTTIEGNMYLEEHLLLFVLNGSITMNYGKQEFIVNKNEMILLKKATVVNYIKHPNPEDGKNHYSLMFSLKDELIKSFLSSAEVEIPHPKIETEITSSVYPMNNHLIAFGKSIKPYFEDKNDALPGLLRVKMLEMLYYVSSTSQNLFYQILQLQEPIPTDVRQVVEQHYATPASISDLAYLSGRSLSSFKRDFQNIYNTSPATWIREKRLSKAKELLQNTHLSITDICHTLGFENISHFSKIFKQYHGNTPSTFRQQ
ncbi:AraC family transcriptional regulator [Chishuiella changwenlii]|uniref:helix-turn-helix domain-containing protein n=1 Tax=Chishuiella changwenlii TaxID=1434701 RepID=UPI002FD8D687